MIRPVRNGFFFFSFMILLLQCRGQNVIGTCYDLAYQFNITLCIIDGGFNTTGPRRDVGISELIPVLKEDNMCIANSTIEDQNIPDFDYFHYIVRNVSQTALVCMVATNQTVDFSTERPLACNISTQPDYFRISKCVCLASGVVVHPDDVLLRNDAVCVQPTAEPGQNGTSPSGSTPGENNASVESTSETTLPNNDRIPGNASVDPTYETNGIDKGANSMNMAIIIPCVCLALCWMDRSCKNGQKRLRARRTKKGKISITKS